MSAVLDCPPALCYLLPQPKSYLQCPAAAQRERGGGVPRRHAPNERSAFAGRESLPLAGAAVVKRGLSSLEPPKPGPGSRTAIETGARRSLRNVGYVNPSGERRETLPQGPMNHGYREREPHGA